MSTSKSKTASLHKTSPSLPRPLYQQVKDMIEKQISIGAWLPQAKIPSEHELVETLHVSRMTVNRALRELTKEGHLIRIQGVGTFVAPRKPQSALLELISIADEIKKRGGVHSSEVHLLQEEMASRKIADAMGLIRGTPVYHSITVHKDSDIAIQLSDRYVNPTFFPDYLHQDFCQITPAEYLLSVSPATEVEHIIEALLPDKQMQTLLEIKTDDPCLVLHRRTWINEIVATKSLFVYPGSRHQIGGRFKPVSNSHPVLT